MRYLVVFIVFMLASCSSTGVVPMNQDMYIIAKKSPQVGFGPPVGTKADVYREASDFCTQEKKEVETVNLEVTDSGFARPGSVSLTFKCI